MAKSEPKDKPKARTVSTTYYGKEPESAVLAKTDATTANLFERIDKLEKRVAALEEQAAYDNLD
jgi:polyhydroxyalkanoate synthesis regulator phasin